MLNFPTSYNPIPAGAWNTVKRAASRALSALNQKVVFAAATALVVLGAAVCIYRAWSARAQQSRIPVQDAFEREFGESHINVMAPILDLFRRVVPVLNDPNDRFEERTQLLNEINTRKAGLINLFNYTHRPENKHMRENEQEILSLYIKNQLLGFLVDNFDINQNENPKKVTDFISLDDNMELIEHFRPVLNFFADAGRNFRVVTPEEIREQLTEIDSICRDIGNNLPDMQT